MDAAPYWRPAEGRPRRVHIASGAHSGPQGRVRGRAGAPPRPPATGRGAVRAATVRLCGQEGRRRRPAVGQGDNECKRSRAPQPAQDAG